jgi:transcriptional regulator with XRE-family HTH domain
VGLGLPPSEARRAELADFLRTRRAAINPADVGLPASTRRRTPGLRREEVAQRSGVGLSWYTWLEQGREITPSDQVLRALSRALELTPSEQDHLFHLAGVPAPELLDGPVSDDTVALVHGLLPHIAIVLSPRFDVIAHNRAAEIILSDLVAVPQPRRNLLRWVFGDGWDRTSPAWADTARANLKDFRYEHARHPGDPEYVALVDELTATSEEFRAWWPAHDVQAMEPVRKDIPHATLGPLHLLASQSRPVHQPWLRLRILVPADPVTAKTIVEALAQDPAA